MQRTRLDGGTGLAAASRSCITMTGKRREVAPSRSRSDGGAYDSSRRKQLLEEPPLAWCRRGDEALAAIQRLAYMTHVSAELAVPLPTQARLQVTDGDTSRSATSHLERQRREGWGGAEFKVQIHYGGL